MSEQIVNPYPLALQEKFERIGWGNFVPTPGVTDEGKEVYITYKDEHFYVMTASDALTLSDEDFENRLWNILYNEQEVAKVLYKQHVLR